MNIKTTATKQLELQSKRISVELSRRHAKKAQAEGEKLLGRSFKYDNAYGSGERWWLYARVIRCEDGRLTAIKFQKTSTDKYEIEPDDYFSLTAGYIKISAHEYDTAWHYFVTEVLNINTKAR